MRSGLIPRISILLNLVLAAALVWEKPRPAEEYATETEQLPAAESGVTQIPTATARPSSPLPWTRIESTNLATYFENLRHAGFPLQLCEAVIVAEFDRRAAQDPPALPPDTNFWRSGPERDELERRRRLAETERARERISTLQQILGPEWHEPTPAHDRLENLAMMADLTGERDPEKLAAAAKLMQRASARSESGLRTPESEAKSREHYDETIAAFRQVLGPAAFEEFQLRAMATDVMDVWGAERLFGCVMSGQEFREFLRIKKEGTLPLHDLFDLEEPELSAEQVANRDSKVRTLLGEERFAGYLRAKDPGYRWIRGSFDPSERTETVWAVFDVYAETKRAARDLRDQIHVPLAERQKAILQLRSAAEARLQQTMGIERYSQYLKRNGGKIGWLEDLAKEEAR